MSHTDVRNLAFLISSLCFCGDVELQLLGFSSFRCQSPVLPLENHEFTPVFMFSPSKTHLLLPDVLPQLFSASVLLLMADSILVFWSRQWCVGPAILFLKRGSTLRTISVGRRCAVVHVAKAPAPLFMIRCVWIGRPLN